MCQEASRGLSLGEACQGPASSLLSPGAVELPALETGDRSDTQQTTAVDAATGEPGVRSRGRGRQGGTGQERSGLSWRVRRRPWGRTSHS